MSHGVVPEGFARSTRVGLAPLARRLHALGVTANAVTVAGFLLTLIGAGLVVGAGPAVAFPVLIAGTLADALDGQLARAAGGGTRFGAFLDSTLDRLSDAALAAAPLMLGAARADATLLWGGLLLLVSSFLVSYTRAKAESLGSSASVGVAPREARIAIYLVGLGAWALTNMIQLFALAVAAAALLATLTLIQRVRHVARALREKES